MASERYPKGDRNHHEEGAMRVDMRGEQQRQAAERDAQQEEAVLPGAPARQGVNQSPHQEHAQWRVVELQGRWVRQYCWVNRRAFPGSEEAKERGQIRANKICSQSDSATQALILGTL